MSTVIARRELTASFNWQRPELVKTLWRIPLPNNDLHLTQIPLAAGAARAASLALSAVPRPASELRAVCAKEHTYGSVRGVPGNRYPYCDSENEG